MIEEMSYFYEFLAKGIDAEDISYFHKSYENLLSQDALQVLSITYVLLEKTRILIFPLQTQGYWLNDTHWVDYDPTEMDPSPSKRKRKEEPRPHKSGSARTEGYYKLDSKEKAKHKSHFARCVTEDSRLLEANVVMLLWMPFHYTFLIHFSFIILVLRTDSWSGSYRYG